MNKEQKHLLSKHLQEVLETSEDLWRSKEQSKDYIIGYLQGSIKGVLSTLNS